MSSLPPYLELARKKLGLWEGYIPHAYLDNEKPPKGPNVTVGLGYLIANVTAMLALPWRTPTGELASPSQIVQEWNRVRSMPGARVASSYYARQGLHLLPEDIDALTTALLDDCVSDLRAKFIDFDSFPSPAKTALVDMRWNLGISRLMKQYPRFCTAVMSWDWKLAALECGRNEKDPGFASRNAWTREMFLNAAAVTGQNKTEAKP